MSDKFPTFNYDIKWFTGPMPILAHCVGEDGSAWFTRIEPDGRWKKATSLPDGTWECTSGPSRNRLHTRALRMQSLRQALEWIGYPFDLVDAHEQGPGPKVEF